MSETAAARAAELDATDPLARYRDLFIQSDDVVAYLDGNSLGRPTVASAARLAKFVTDRWADRLIRGWDEAWYDLPLVIGDRLGDVVLGAAPGQTFIGDSTTVILYKLIRAAVDACPNRTEIVVDSGNFPTDRFVLEGIAQERGKILRWINPAPSQGVTPEQVAAVTGPDTALVVLSHIAYRSAYLSDAEAITRISHEVGALMLWDLSHSVGAVPIDLDAWGVDLAVGCTYKYLNGGPGSPAFGYVRQELQSQLTQPIYGWMGSAEPFEMGPRYEPHDGIRRFISGTPAIIGMLAMQDMLDLIEEAGIDHLRSKSVKLTEFVIELSDSTLASLGVVLASPRESARRGSHVTIDHPDFQKVNALLWAQGIIPDFRGPDGIRLGLSPLSTSFAEVEIGLDAIRNALAR